jgi:hypothetical protein
MQEKANDWKNQLDEITAKFNRELEALPWEKLYQKPSPASWSIAENIHHLIKVNASYFPIFQQLLDNSYQPAWSGKFAFIYNTIGNAIYKSVSEGRKKKIKTFKSWEPGILGQQEDILKMFESHQEELKGWIDKLKPYLEKNVVINSPVNKMISYTLDKAFDIIVAHEDRHFHQSKEVKDSVAS